MTAAKNIIRKPRNVKTGKRMKLGPAADILGMSREALILMVNRGVFTCQQDVVEGDRYVLTDELEFWIEALGGPEERQERLRDFRIRKRRIKAGKRKSPLPHPSMEHQR